MFKAFTMSTERRNAIAKFSLYFYVLFAGLLVFADASRRGDYLQMVFGLIAIPTAMTLRSFLRATPGKSS
jgi:hypothetical protein